MSSPEVTPEIRQQSQFDNRTSLNHAQKESESPVRNVDLPAHSQRSTSSTQRLNVLMSNLRTDPFCWLCHSTVGEVVSPVRCRQCRRLFHKSCWKSHFSAVFNADNGIANLPESCMECLAIAEENARPDKVLSRVGSAKFKSFLLYMLHFVEEKLEKENAGPFAKSTRHSIDCDEALCPAALLRLKQKIADGQVYMTYAEFLADLRGLLHKSIVIHGEDSGYSRAANYVLDSCMQLCNSMDWCEECFERALPRPGETLIAAILRSLVNPCSKLHVVVCVKVLGKLWPALVYRFDGEFVNVRFFGTMEFGRVHKTSTFLLYEEFELELPGEQTERTSTDAAYEHALRQCRLHISKLMLIPECSVEFFPKVTPYDGRLFMKIHSIHSLLIKNPSLSKSSFDSQMLNGNVEGIKRSGNAEKRQNTNCFSSEKSKRLRFSSPSISPTSVFSSEVSNRQRSDVNVAAAKQKREHTLFKQADSRGNSPESFRHRDSVLRGAELEILTPNDLQGGRWIQKQNSKGLSLNHSNVSVLRRDGAQNLNVRGSGVSSVGARVADGPRITDVSRTGDGSRPILHSQTSRKTAEPRRFPHLTDSFSKNIIVPIGSQRGLPVASSKTRENSVPVFSSSEELAQSKKSHLDLLATGELSSNFKSNKVESLSSAPAGDLRETTLGSPIGFCNGGNSNDVILISTDTERENNFELATPISDERDDSQSSVKEPQQTTANSGKPSRSPEPVEQRQKQQNGGNIAQKKLLQIFEEMAKVSETQQNLMEKVQQEISLVGRECIRQFAETQEKLEAMCQSQLKQSQQVFATAGKQLQTIAEWVTIQGTTEPEALAYKRGRQDALRNRANWIDQTKQNFWCCVCRHQARLLCCGVTLYCSEACQRADHRQHSEHCRRLLVAGFDDSLIQTPYGDLSICQTLPHSDLNTPSPQDELDQLEQVENS